MAAQRGQSPVGVRAHPQFAADHLQHGAVLGYDEGDPLGRCEREAPLDAEPFPDRPVEVGEQRAAQLCRSVNSFCRSTASPLIPTGRAPAAVNSAARSRKWHASAVHPAGEGGGVEEQHDRPLAEQFGQTPVVPVSSGSVEVLHLCRPSSRRVVMTVPPRLGRRRAPTAPAAPGAAAGQGRGPQRRGAVAPVHGHLDVGREHADEEGGAGQRRDPARAGERHPGRQRQFDGAARPCPCAGRSREHPWDGGVERPWTAKWAAPAAARRPASSKGERSDRGTVPPRGPVTRLYWRVGARGAGGVALFGRQAAGGARPRTAPRRWLIGERKRARYSSAV